MSTQNEISTCFGLEEARTDTAPHLTTITRVVLLTALCFLGSLLGRQAAFRSGTMPLMWPPAGIALAAILLFGFKFWPGVVLGALLFALMDGIPSASMIFGTVLGSTAGAVGCAFLLKRAGFDNRLERTQDVAGFLGLACLAGAGLNAALGLLSVTGPGAKLALSTLVAWWVPYALAALVVTPFALAWGTRSALRWDARLTVEAVICGAGLLVGTVLAFHSWFEPGIQSYPLVYMPFPFLVWASLRFGPRGATAGTLLVSALAFQSQLNGRGPFATGLEREGVMLMGSYIGFLAVTNLLLAAGAAERRRAEEARAESQGRLLAVVEDQTDMICRFKPDGTLTFVNSVYCRFEGKSREELLGTNFLQKLALENPEVPLAWFETLPPEQPVVAFDHRVISADGLALWQQYTVRRLFRAQGDTFEFQAVIEDITLRKQSEQALRDSERKLRSLVANIPDVVWTADANRSLIYASDNAAKLLGYTADELLQARGTLWLGRIHPDDLARVEFAYDALFESEAGYDIEYRICRRDGEWIWVHDRAPATHIQDGVRCADGLLSEVTQRKRVETALQSAKTAAEAASRAKSQFLANMSHELRTPLNAIIGFSEILADGTFGELNERQAKYAGNILNSGRHLLQVINDVLDLAKVEAGRLELIRTSFSVATALQDVHAIVRTLASKKDIKLDFKSAADLPPLQADEAKFKQIMYNLLSNAIKFTPNGGRVSVAAMRHRGSSGESGPAGLVAGECLKVTVTDTGVGIRHEDQDRVFAEFEQVNSPYGRQQQGTGLGLTLTRNLVEMHGGRIWVESEGIEGRGSQFTFLIPLQPEAPAETRPHSTADLLRPTALIIEDEPALLDLLTKTLRYRGLQVLRAADGRRGLELAAGRHPDVIILDLELPECNGLKLVELLRARPKTRNIPILVHTGAVLTDTERQHLAAQVQAISSKSEPATLLANLERLEFLNPQTLGTR